MPQLTRDWSAVKKVDPELWWIVQKLQEFLHEIPTMNHIDPGRLIHKYKLTVDQAIELYRALEIARDRRLVKRSWAVLAPRSHCQAPGYWDKLSSIPGKIYDSSDDPFRRSDGKIIVIYRHPEAEDPDPR